LTTESYESSGPATASIRIALLAGLFVGCGDGKPRAVPVSGRLTVDGAPAEGVQLIFYAEDPPSAELQVPTPRAYTNAAGEFSAATYTGGDGAPAGTYRVAAIHQEETPSGVDPESFEAVDKLSGRYADPDTSGLTIDVPPEGVTSVLLELRSGP